MALNVKNILDYSEVPKSVDQEEVEHLLNSNLFEDKLLLQKLLIKGIIPQEIRTLENLLNYDNKVIKTATIHMVNKFKSDEFLKMLVKYVESDEYYHICGEALLATGDKVLDDFNEYFKKKASPAILIRIIQILAKIGSTKAKSILLSHINYPDRNVQHEVITALYFCKFQAKDNEIPIIRKKLEELIDNILWIYSCVLDIEAERNTLKLMQALDVDRQIRFEMLFKLLGFMYDPRIINIIRKNIIGQNTIFAIEIIDNFISKDVKNLITPLFDDISTVQKIKKYNKIFPQTKLGFYNRLKDIIVQDYDKLGEWSISKAIELIGRIHSKGKGTQDSDENLRNYNDVAIWSKENTAKILHRIKRSEIPDEVFLCLFHPDEIVYSTAARIIFEENPLKCAEYLENMSDNKKHLLKDLQNNGYILSDKIKLLKKHSMLFSLPENYIAVLAKVCTVAMLEKGEFMNTTDDSGEDRVIIIVKGSLEATDYNKKVVEFKKNERIMPGINLHKSISKLQVTSRTSALLINKYDYFNIMLDETEIVQHAFDVISSIS